MDHDPSKKKMRLPVYHAPQNDDTITLRLCIRPRQAERFLFIIIIVILLSFLIIQPNWLIRDKTGQESSSIALQQTTQAAPQATAEPAATEPIEIPEEETAEATDIPAEEETPGEIIEEIEATTEATDEASEGPIDPEEIMLQVTGFVIEKKSSTWYKLLGIDVRVTNSGGRFSPQVKAWYYDDATRPYFQLETDPPKDQQSYSTPVDAGQIRTFNLREIDESFSGRALNPTVIVKLYDYATKKELKTLTVPVSWNENDFS